MNVVHTHIALLRLSASEDTYYRVINQGNTTIDNPRLYADTVALSGVIMARENHEIGALEPTGYVKYAICVQSCVVTRTGERDLDTFHYSGVNLGQSTPQNLKYCPRASFAWCRMQWCSVHRGK